MSAIKIPIMETEFTVPKEALTHIEILTDLLRDIDLEKRMETLIKADNLLEHWKHGSDEGNSELELIREDLEEEFKQVRLMIFMVEQAQYFIETTK